MAEYTIKFIRNSINVSNRWDGSEYIDVLSVAFKIPELVKGKQYNVIVDMPTSKQAIVLKIKELISASLKNHSDKTNNMRNLFPDSIKVNV